MDSEYIVLAKVVARYKRSGDFVFAFYGSAKEELLDFDSFYVKDAAGYAKAPNISFRISQDKIIGAIEGVSSLVREDFTYWKGSLIYVERSLLPRLSDKEFYHVDIMGFVCIDSNNTEFGKLEDVVNFGAGDLFQIRSCKKLLYLPIASLVKEISFARRTVYFGDLEGFI